MALIYAKTDDGREEIQTRERRLSAVMRSVLLSVDGQRDEVELNLLAQGVRAPADALAQLSALGLIVVVGGSPQKVAEQPVTAGWGADTERAKLLGEWMVTSVRRHLGLKSYLMQLRIERCHSGLELERLWPEIAAAMGKAKSPAFASRWLDEARERALQAEPLQA